MYCGVVFLYVVDNFHKLLLISCIVLSLLTALVKISSKHNEKCIFLNTKWLILKLIDKINAFQKEISGFTKKLGLI